MCCPKGIYVTRITPGGPADVAGLMAGDKIMQVCSEIWWRATRWQCVYTAVSDRHCLLCLCSCCYAVNKDGVKQNGFTLYSNKVLFFSFFQVNGWDMTMVTHDQARKKLTKKGEDVVRLLVTRKSLENAVKNSMGNYYKQ